MADVHRSVFEKDPELAFLPVFTGIQNAEFAKLFDVMIARFQSPFSMSRMETDAWAVIFAETLIKEAPGFSNQSAVRPSGTLSTAEMNLISDWVAEHIGRSITVSELAKLTRVSEYDFARRFQATAGMSPYQYVLNQRMQRARELLETSSDSIAQIAFAVGFSSQAHMTDSFRQRLGTTPGAYRKSLF
ncbi:MAG: helix-turn-helix domain-containing protein [Pseudomonadota bacterium]